MLSRTELAQACGQMETGVIWASCECGRYCEVLSVLLRYEGMWQDGRPHGYGQLTYSDRDDRGRDYYAVRMYLCVTAAGACVSALGVID